MVNVKRYVQVRGCADCNIEVPYAGQCCPQCGATFGGYSGSIKLNLVLTETFVPCKIKWYKPITWKGGSWVRENSYNSDFNKGEIK